MGELLGVIKDLLVFANLLLVVLILPAIKYIKASTQTNIELKQTLSSLREEMGLLRSILFDIADGEIIKKHIAEHKNGRNNKAA